MPNYRIFGAPFIYQNLFQVANQKNLALDCCWACWKVSKMVCCNLIAHKLTKKIGSPEIDFCQIRDLMVCTLGSHHQPNDTSFVEYWLWKFGQNSIFQSKVNSIYAHRQTHRHTFCIPIAGMRFFTQWNLSLHQVHSIALLTHSLHL